MARLGLVPFMSIMVETPPTVFSDTERLLKRPLRDDERKLLSDIFQTTIRAYDMFDVGPKAGDVRKWLKKSRNLAVCRTFLLRVSRSKKSAIGLSSG